MFWEFFLIYDTHVWFLPAQKISYKHSTKKNLAAKPPQGVYIQSYIPHPCQDHVMLLHVVLEFVRSFEPFRTDAAYVWTQVRMHELVIPQWRIGIESLATYGAYDMTFHQCQCSRFLSNCLAVCTALSHTENRDVPFVCIVKCRASPAPGSNFSRDRVFSWSISFPVCSAPSLLHSLFGHFGSPEFSKQITRSWSDNDQGCVRKL